MHIYYYCFYDERKKQLMQTMDTEKSEENARMTQIQWPKTMAKQKASESDGHKMHLNGKYKNRANGRCLSRRSGERVKKNS